MAVLPRFDSPPLFCSVLDHACGGAFRIVPDGLRESRQFYDPDSAVLIGGREGAALSVRTGGIAGGPRRARGCVSALQLLARG
ncbi:MAG: hypothetical protein ACXW4C_09535 [Nitrospira sp.]